MDKFSGDLAPRVQAKFHPNSRNRNMSRRTLLIMILRDV